MGGEPVLIMRGEGVAQGGGGGGGKGLVRRGGGGGCCDEALGEGQASIPGLGFGGVQGGGGEVRKGKFGGNPWLGWGDGKIIPPVWLGDLPSEGEGGVVFSFRTVNFLKGDHVTAHGEGEKVVHREHLAHTLPGLTQPLPLQNH